eukprot:361930-Prymnesium_polylepis.2
MDGCAGTWSLGCTPYVRAAVRAPPSGALNLSPSGVPHPANQPERVKNVQPQLGEKEEVTAVVSLGKVDQLALHGNMPTSASGAHEVGPAQLGQAVLFEPIFGHPSRGMVGGRLCVCQTAVCFAATWDHWIVPVHVQRVGPRPFGVHSCTVDIDGVAKSHCNIEHASSRVTRSQRLD